MAQYSQRFIRSVIRQVWNQAPVGAFTFREALNAGQSGYWEQVATGWTVSSSSGAGYSTSFHIAAGPNDTAGMTPTDWQELFERILEYYALVIAAGIAEDGVAAGENIDAMDSQFVAALWRYFPTVKGYADNFMYQNP